MVILLAGIPLLFLIYQFEIVSEILINVLILGILVLTV